MYHEDTLYELSSDEQVRLDYERRLKALRDRNSQIEGYYQDGLTKGRAEGKLEIARKMRAMGDSADKIYALTGIAQDML